MTSKSSDELDQSLNYGIVTEDDLSSLSIVYKVMLNGTSEKVREHYQAMLFELQHRLPLAPHKAESELSQSLTDARVSEEDLRALSKAYAVMLDGCPEGQKKCWDGSCVDEIDPCPPEPPGVW